MACEGLAGADPHLVDEGDRVGQRELQAPAAAAAEETAAAAPAASSAETSAATATFTATAAFGWRRSSTAFGRRSRGRSGL